MISIEIVKTIGGISLVSFCTRKILSKLGKKAEENMIDLVAVILIVTNVLETVIKVKQI